jgi:hypothetical protein
MNNKIVFNNIKFDYIIPLGEECYTCQSIDQKFNKNIRACGFPYDYVGHVFVEKIYENLSDLLLQKNIENDYDLCFFTDKYYFVDKIYGFKYWHDICQKEISYFSENDKKDFSDKYKRRTQKLINIIKEKKNNINYKCKSI